MLNSNVGLLDHKRRQDRNDQSPLFKTRIIQPQNGLSLLEILISLIILAVGMLGLASMLLVSNQANNSSYMKQQAIQSVNNILDKIRANTQGAVDGDYNVSNIGSNGLPQAITAPSVLCNTTCSVAQLAAYDTWNWLSKDVSKLPNGCGSITTATSGTTGNTVITVTVQWDDSAAQALVGAANQVSSVNPKFVQIMIQSQI